MYPNILIYKTSIRFFAFHIPFISNFFCFLVRSHRINFFLLLLVDQGKKQSNTTDVLIDLMINRNTIVLREMIVTYRKISVLNKKVVWINVWFKIKCQNLKCAKNGRLVICFLRVKVTSTCL